MNAASAPRILERVTQPNVAEFMHYQDMPISMPGIYIARLEPRLRCLASFVERVRSDVAWHRGSLAFIDSYVYLTVKQAWQVAGGNPINRPGYHCDGFGTDDLMYVWSDVDQTEFSRSAFDLEGDETSSMTRMEQQAQREDAYQLPSGTLVCMDAKCVHRPAIPTVTGPRTFIKVTVSRHKYDLAGNTRNWLLDYSWPMRPRTAARNVPTAK